VEITAITGEVKVGEEAVVVPLKSVDTEIPQLLPAIAVMIALKGSPMLVEVPSTLPFLQQQTTPTQHHSLVS
jgi:hypothetical protein